MQNICEEKIIVRYCYVDGLWNRGDVDKTCNNEGIRSTGGIDPGETVEVWSGVKQPRNSAESSPLIMVACRGVNASTRCWSDEFDGYDLSPSGEIFGNKNYIHPREKTKVRSISGGKCFFPGFSISEGVYAGHCKDGIPSFPGALYYESSMNGKLNRILMIFAEDNYIGWRIEEEGKKYYTLNSEGKIPVWVANILLNRGSKGLLDRQEVRQAIDIVHTGFSRNPKNEESVQKLIDSSFPLTAATTLPLKTAQLPEKPSAEAPRLDTAKSANSVTDAWVAVYTIESDRGNDARPIYTRAESKDKALENFREYFSKDYPWLRNIKYDVIKCEPGWGANFNFRDDYAATEADGISCGAIDPQSAIQTAYAECKKRYSRCGQPGVNIGHNVRVKIATFKVGGMPKNSSNKRTNTNDPSIISEEMSYFDFLSLYTENFFHSENSDYSLSEGDSRNIFQYMKNLGFPVR